ncbi:MAG TPA: hypothetical protein VMT28_08025 [Terriglobales bacterium]|nr:hypothetical protein [Terriglobales bacterium]
MSVSAITANGNTPIHQSSMRQDLQALQKALNADDLTAAQQAFADFKDDFHAAHHGHALYQTHMPGDIQQDLRGLQAALNAGDLAAAQQAFAAFQHDMPHHIRGTQPPTDNPSVSLPSDGATTQSVNVIG